MCVCVGGGGWREASNRVGTCKEAEALSGREWGTQGHRMDTIRESGQGSRVWNRRARTVPSNNVFCTVHNS